MVTRSSSSSLYRSSSSSFGSSAPRKTRCIISTNSSYLKTNLGRDQQYLSYVRSSLWIGILRMSWPKVALMISLPVKSSLLKLPSIWEQSLISARVWTSCSGIANINYHVTAAVLIFTELNEVEYITVSGGGRWNVGHRDKKYNWQVASAQVCSSHAKNWSLGPVFWTSGVPFSIRLLWPFQALPVHSGLIRVVSNPISGYQSQLCPMLQEHVARSLLRVDPNAIVRDNCAENADNKMCLRMSHTERMFSFC